MSRAKNKKTKRKSSKARKLSMEQFEQEQILTQAQARGKKDFEVYGLFVDRKDKEKRIIILVSKDSDAKALTKVAKPYFKDDVFKIVYLDDIAKGTTALETGSSILYKREKGFGTVGGLFKLDRGPQRYGLSNNHVIADLNQARLQSRITNKSGKTVGHLHDFVDLHPWPQPNFIDVAIFKLAAHQNSRWKPQKPKGVIGGRVGMRVYKKGAATGITTGIITGLGNMILVNLNGRIHLFKDVFAIRGLGGHDFSGPGDSGSLVLSHNHYIAGILFAKNGPFSYACRIKYTAPMGLRMV